jgi:hypothetical protein
LVLDSHHIWPSPTPSPLAPSFFTHNFKLGGSCCCCALPMTMQMMKSMMSWFCANSISLN